MVDAGIYRFSALVSYFEVVQSWVFLDPHGKIRVAVLPPAEMVVPPAKLLLPPEGVYPINSSISTGFPAKEAPNAD